MKIYLDNCCYNRPFDDQTQERIYLESESILVVLKRGQQNIDTIVGSAILDLEINRMSDERKKQKVKELYKIATIYIPYSEKILRRSKEIMEQSKIRPFDSLHIASAEIAEANVMLITDDKLEKIAAKLRLKVKISNPLKFVWEVL